MAWRRGAVVLVLLVASCGPGGPTTAPTATGPPPTTPAATTPTAAGPRGDPCAGAPVDLTTFAFIFVAEPTPGGVLRSGDAVRGCANTFEASVVWRLVDSDGIELASGHTTATCGTGCVGQFTFTVSYTVTAAQIGTLEVFDLSAADGSVVHLNAIPVVLLP